MITINFSLDDQSKAGGGAVADAALESNPQPTPIATSQPAPAPVRVSSAVMAGLLLRRGSPEGSNLAKAAKEGGIVVLRAIISKTGTVSDLQVISGAMILRAPVLNSVKQWTYRPYLLNGQPVDVETQIVVKYSPLTGAQ
jgi:periplasmic protein TonB